MKRFSIILIALLLISGCSVTPSDASPSESPSEKSSYSPSGSPSEEPSPSTGPRNFDDMHFDWPQPVGAKMFNVPPFNVEFNDMQELLCYQRLDTSKNESWTYYEFFLYNDYSEHFEKYGFSASPDIYLRIRYDYDNSTVLTKLFDVGISEPGIRIAHITGNRDIPDILVSGYPGGSGGTTAYALLSFEDMVVTDRFAEAGLTYGLTQEMLEPLYAKHGITSENPETYYQSVSLVGTDAAEGSRQSNNQRLLVISDIWENGLPRDTIGTLYVTMRYIDGEWAVEQSLYEKSSNFP